METNTTIIDAMNLYFDISQKHKFEKEDIDLNKSFNKLKTEIMLDEKQLNDKLDSAYNKGIEQAITFVKSQRDMYKAISPLGNETNVCQAIVATLEHFKKPVSNKKEGVI